MRRVYPVVLFVVFVFLALPALARAADLRITDSSGAQLIVKSASIDYPGAIGAMVRESGGIRVQQGDATVTVKWKDIQSLQVVPGDNASRPERVDVDIRLRSGRQVRAALQRPADARLRGTTDLGDYSLELHKVRSIEPLR